MGSYFRNQKGDIDEQYGLRTHELHILLFSSLTAVILVVCLSENCVVVLLVGVGQCFLVPVALFCSENMLSCIFKVVVALINWMFLLTQEALI